MTQSVYPYAIWKWTRHTFYRHKNFDKKKCTKWIVFPLKVSVSLPQHTKQSQKANIWHQEEWIRSWCGGSTLNFLMISEGWEGGDWSVGSGWSLFCGLLVGCGGVGGEGRVGSGRGVTDESGVIESIRRDVFLYVLTPVILCRVWAFFEKRSYNYTNFLSFLSILH